MRYVVNRGFQSTSLRPADGTDGSWQQFVPLINLEREIGTKEYFPTDYLPAFQSLWVDDGVKQAIVKGNEYALHDNLI